MLYSIKKVADGPKRRGRPRKQRDPDNEDTDRTTITLPAFQLFELRGLKGIYAPTITAVVEWIVSDWLASNQQNIEIRRRRHMEYLASLEKNGSDTPA
jgi:hypothetical protein